MRGNASDHTRGDLRCIGCGYNLRELPAERNCPECGNPIIRSIIKAILHASEDELPSQDRKLQCLEVIARHTSYPTDALYFIYDVFNFATEEAAASRDLFAGERRRVSAREVWQSVREYGLDYFGTAGESILVLKEWNVNRSEDVGSLVYSLVWAGLLGESKGDRLEDFDGLGTVETLFGDADD